MLRKLIKYDLLWINRVMVYYYALTIVLSVLMRIAENFTGSVMGDIVYGILRGFVIAAFANVIINAAIRIWVRFTQNHYKDEAYLTHTLPATKAQLFDSKAISALISTLTAVAIVIVCFFIAFWNNDMYTYFHNLVEYGNAAPIIAGIFITSLLEVLYIVIVGLFGIVVGHRFNNGRMLRSIIIGMVLYFALQCILLAAIYAAGSFDDSIKAMFSNNPQNSISLDSYRTLIIITDVIYVVINTGLYFSAKKLFQKGVNVD
ncbi:hypothetical protein J5500_02155 [Candidatus Saccharibacteria bacterium]|nr:hypothetical protein [Candidatus Saccharibacteria bacterium]